MSRRLCFGKSNSSICRLVACLMAEFPRQWLAWVGDYFVCGGLWWGSRGVEGDGKAGSFAEADCCVFFHGDSAGERHAELQRRTWRVGWRYGAGSGGYQAADGGGVAAVPQGILYSAVGGGWDADRGAGGVAGGGFSSRRGGAGERAAGEQAGGVAGLAV